LFSVSISGHAAFLYVLFEHQSTVDELMPFRLLRYMVQIWDKHLLKHPKAKRLPAILPLVLHHSERGWTKATAFEELFDLEAEALAPIAPYLPHFQFLLDNLIAESDEALKARAIMSAFSRLVLFCFRNARNPDRITQGLRGWVDLIRETRRAPNGVAALKMLWHYILAIDEQRQPKEILAQLMEVLGEDGKEEIMTAAELLREEGRNEGLQKGQRRMLLKQLGIRFGELPEAAVARVNGADVAQLELWAERVLRASSLADVLADA
jgi:hypothetical protein